jgi:hypothetical protein
LPGSSWDTEGANTGPPDPYFLLSPAIVCPAALGKSSGLATDGAVAAPPPPPDPPPQPPSNTAAASAAAIQVRGFLTRQ